MLTAVIALLCSTAHPEFLDRAIGDRYGRIVIDGNTPSGNRVILGPPTGK